MLKKGNVALFAFVTIASIFLLWLWYYLGFSRAGSYLEVVLSIIWWAAIAVLLYVLFRVEQQRRMHIRTIYVSPTALYNCERGVVECPDPRYRVALMQDILDNLQYSFVTSTAMPVELEQDITHIVHTDSFDDDVTNAPDMPVGDIVSPDYDNVTWTGTVVKVIGAGRNEESRFNGRSSLAAVLAA